MEVKDTKTTKLQQQSQQENISEEKQQPSKAGGKMQVIFGGICVGLILLLFYLMELCTGDPAMLMMPVALLNPLLLLVLVYVFTTLFNNLKGGMILTLLLMLVFTVADICAQSFRGVPLLAPDLMIAGTALSVADRFHFSPDTHLKIFMTADVLGIFLVGFFPANVKFHGKGRRNQAIIAAFLIAGCVYLFGFSGLLEQAGVTVSHFNPQKSYASNGAVLTFIRSGQMAVLQKPEGYTEEKADAILADYVDAYLQDDQTYKKPNVIVMMNEAFSDVQSVGKGFETNEEVMPFIKSLTENTVKGTAYSSVFGGYTANSEYEFLTGLSMEDLGGVAPFQFLIKKPMESLVTDLKAEGYGGLSAMHPFLRDGYQRPLAYENLGFSTYLGLEDIEDREHTLLRGYVSDASDVDELIRMYEEAKKENDGPVFLYNVTMQNHSPYDGDYADLPKDIQVSDQEVRSKVLTNYLNLIRCSDAA
ncbi:MAG: LTA synthase family protein, partial [Lachnospiraceae bacterium]|nr:LTA synthase family protein [Lachnospiraceae bacterium]